MSESAPAKPKKKIPKVKGFSDHESFHANFIGFMSLGMALCQIPYIIVIFLLMWVRKDHSMAFISFVFIVFMILMMWFGIKRSKALDAMPQEDRQAVVTQRDVYFKQLLIMQLISFIVLIALFALALF